MEDNRSIFEIINTCKEWLDTIEDFYKVGDIGFADIARRELVNDLEHLECAFEVEQ